MEQGRGVHGDGWHDRTHRRQVVPSFLGTAVPHRSCRRMVRTPLARIEHVDLDGFEVR